MPKCPVVFFCTHNSYSSTSEPRQHTIGIHVSAIAAVGLTLLNFSAMRSHMMHVCVERQLNPSMVLSKEISRHAK